MIGGWLRALACCTVGHFAAQSFATRRTPRGVRFLMMGTGGRRPPAATGWRVAHAVCISPATSGEQRPQVHATPLLRVAEDRWPLGRQEPPWAVTHAAPLPLRPVDMLHPSVAPTMFLSE